MRTWTGGLGACLTILDEVEVGDGEEWTITVADYTRLVSLYGQLCFRLGRLMRDRQQLQGGEDSELESAIYEALDLAGEMLGVELRSARLGNRSRAALVWLTHI